MGNREQIAGPLEPNCDAFDQVAVEYQSDSLFPSERAVLERYKSQWRQWAVLDLGVGTGRTTRQWAPLAKKYIGLDYSSWMLAEGKKQLPSELAEMNRIGDARDLVFLQNESIDFCLFSYNGIDYVSIADRVRIYREIYRVLRSGGLFFFSQHSLNAFPFVWTSPQKRRGWLRFIRDCIKSRWVFEKTKFGNRYVSSAVSRKVGWAILNDGAHNFSLRTLYMTPEFQRNQLREIGFDVLEVTDLNGKILPETLTSNDYSLHWLCRKP